MRKSPWFIASFVACLIISIPILTIVFFFLQPQLAIWAYLWDTRLLELIWNTARLALGVGVGTFLVGTHLAWLVVMYQFPGRRYFEGLLLLPLAMPGYVIGFVFLSQWDYTGTVPALLREWVGFNFWMPEVRSYLGVVFVLTLVLYPYVYLLSLSAFRGQNVALLEAAICLGKTRKQLFWQVALPMARPSIAIGVLLALMETLADFGTVEIFSYDTFTTAIYELWFGLFNKEAAIQLAGLLLLFTLILFYLEAKTRGEAQYYQVHGKARPHTRFVLKGKRLVIAILYPSLILGLAFVYPVSILGIWVFEGLAEQLDAQYWELLQNTLSVATISGGMALLLAVLFAYGKRLFPQKLMVGITRFASMGYALPGSVIAVGTLLPLATADRWLNHVSERWFNESLGLLLTGSIAGMVFAYTARFLAVSFNSVDTNLSAITPTMDMAAFTLGNHRREVLWKIHVPLLRNGLVIGFIIVFVDVMKEMPATLLLRPFGFSTLATRIWELTAESYWSEAALPALTIVCAALIPVLFLIKLGNPEKFQHNPL